MLKHVSFQSDIVGTCKITLFAIEQLFPIVREHVFLQLCRLEAIVVALCATERLLLAIVLKHVSLQSDSPGACKVTLLALEWLITNVLQHVVLQY